MREFVVIHLLLARPQAQVAARLTGSGETAKLSVNEFSKSVAAGSAARLVYPQIREARVDLRDSFAYLSGAGLRDG